MGNSKFFSVLADETTDTATIEQLALCVRYLKDEEKTIQEEFLGFVELKKQNAETISNAILNKIQEWGMDSAKLHGPGYDGASVMSGEVGGVQAKISAALPKAKYFTHDCNHRLNLVIVASCKIPEIRNFMQSFQTLTFHFSYSAKRKEILKKHLKDSNSLENVLVDHPGDGQRSNDVEMGVPKGIFILLV